MLEQVTLDRWRADIPYVFRAIGAEVVGSAADGMGLALLVATGSGADAVGAVVRSAGGADVRASEIGAHASRSTLPRCASLL